MRFDRRLLTHFEWLLPLLILSICGLGILTVYSASYTPGMETPPPLAMRQMTWFAAGIAGMLVMLSFDYRRLDRRAYLIYFLVLGAVLAVPLVGEVGGGSRRWIRLGPVSIQPSEFVKLAIVIVLAHYFSRTPPARLGLREATVPLLLTAVPAFAILIQPDLGSAALLCFVSVTMLVLGGVRLRWLALLASPVLMLAPMLWGHLKEYQQKRILMFIDPAQDPLGAGYHIIQSKIAVGSGMIWGKGFLQGTQNHLNFLPEQHTDFIFSVFSEEWGLIGAGILMALYLGALLRGMLIASRARDRFGVLLALGVMSIVFWQVVVNVGMTTGLLPVVGIPLPFFSYGGSSLLCLLVGVGLVMNVSTRRFLF
ncbi:MAG TPA: rod shape-determining protein RodA [Candidatus Binatia bacterium]|jgi:rod shape determining protein RodA|nr:rod shape-determining protein RodA [Candidatus Binatia bacterium]